MELMATAALLQNGHGVMELTATIETRLHMLMHQQERTLFV
jgi:hypothetical protein